MERKKIRAMCKSVGMHNMQHKSKRYKRLRSLPIPAHSAGKQVLRQLVEVDMGDACTQHKSRPSPSLSVMHAHSTRAALPPP